MMSSGSAPILAAGGPPHHAVSQPDPGSLVQKVRKGWSGACRKVPARTGLPRCVSQSGVENRIMTRCTGPMARPASADALAEEEDRTESPMHSRRSTCSTLSGTVMMTALAATCAPPATSSSTPERRQRTPVTGVPSRSSTRDGVEALQHEVDERAVAAGGPSLFCLDARVAGPLLHDGLQAGALGIGGIETLQHVPHPAGRLGEGGVLSYFVEKGGDRAVLLFLAGELEEVMQVAQLVVHALEPAVGEHPVFAVERDEVDPGRPHQVERGLRAPVDELGAEFDGL